MSSNRSVSLVLLLAAALLVAGCPESKSKIVLPTDADSESETGGGGEVGELDVVPELDPVDDRIEQPDEIEPPEEVEQPDETVEPDEVEPPPDPELSFCIITADNGCHDQFSECLTPDDDKDDALPGLQVVVRVTLEHVDVGAKVELWVDGKLAKSMNNPSGQFNFDQITLSHKPAGHLVEVKVPKVVSANLTVCVDNGLCGITVAPANTGCFQEDADGAAAGFQMVFTVTNDDTDCDKAWVTVGGNDYPAAHADLVAGKTDITVTMTPDTAALVCQGIVVSASVADSANPERLATDGPLTYVVHDSTPVVLIAEPAVEAVNLSDDVDKVKPGIQLTVAGTAVGLGGDDDLVALWVDGKFVETKLAPSGEFEFEVTLAAPTGAHTIEVRAEDCCGNEGVDIIPLMAVHEQHFLLIDAPAANEVLWAKDNGPAGTATAYDTLFSVRAPVCGPGDTLTVQCRQDVPGTFYQNVATFTVEEKAPDWTYEVPVLLETKKFGTGLLCRLMSTKMGTVVSPEVAITVAMPPPILIITAPEAGLPMDPAEIVVSGAATALDGQEVTIALAGEGKSYEWSTIAGPLSFFLSDALDDAPDGLYALTVEAADIFGNLASEQVGSVTTVDVVLDSLPPELSFVAPKDQDHCAPPACLDAVGDDIMPGHQVEVSVEVSGELELIEETVVCLTVNGVPQKPCATPVASGASYHASFFGITLVPGTNTLSVVGTDYLGHAGEPVVATVTLDSPAPRVTFIAPAKNLVTSAEPVTVLAAVHTPDGQTALDDAVVTLLLANGEYATLDGAQGGTFEFEVSGLTPNQPVLLQLRATHADFEQAGYSDLRLVTLKANAPAVQILSPVTDTLYSLASAECAVGSAGCKLAQVTGATQDVEAGQVAKLGAACTGDAQLSYTAKVAANGSLSWKNVELPDNSTCTLIAEVADEAGQNAASEAVTVQIDRTAPAITQFAAPPKSIVASTYDLEPQTPGFQFEVQLTLKGVEAGNQLKLLVEPEKAAPQTLSVEIVADVPDAFTKKIGMAKATFEPGLNTLTASVSDNAGNSATLSKDFVFLMDPTEVSFEHVGAVADKACSASTQCGAGICVQTVQGKRCVTPWKAAKQAVTAYTIPVEMFQGSKQLRVCSDHADLTTALCSDGTLGQFRVLKTVDVLTIGTSIEFPKSEVQSMPQGLHRIFLEAKSNEDGSWVSSVATATIDNTAAKSILVDTKPPVLQSLTFPDDKLPSDGWLNQSEAVSGSIFEAQVTAAGAAEGVVAVTVTGVAIPDQSLGADEPQIKQLQLLLAQGYNKVCTTVRDLVGNPSEQLCKETNVDTFPPSLSFVYPKDQAVLISGSSADVKVLTESGLTVTLAGTKDGVPVSGTAVANAGGTATVVGFLATDGVWQFTATATDKAGNQATKATTPAVITIDRSPPVLGMIAPVDGVALVMADDADPVASGFQVQVQFDLADAVSWTVETLRCPDGTFVGCETPVFKAAGETTGAVSTPITLAKLLTAVEYRIVRVTAVDGNGNESVAERTLSLTLGECIVAFSNLPENGFFNNQLCLVPGQDCADAVVPVEVTVVGGCSGANHLVLFADDAPMGDNATFGQAPALFDVPVGHGDLVTLQARLFVDDLETGDETPEITVEADFLAPLPVLVSPASDPFLCSMAVDLNAGEPGCQFAAQVTVTDENGVGGEAQLIVAAGDGESVIASQAIDSENFAHLFPSVSMAEGGDRQLVLRASDAAGNIGEDVVDAAADVTPPAAIELAAIAAEDVNPRRPGVNLNWVAVGGDGNGGGAAAGYEFRYSDQPIVNEQQFNDACDAAELAGTASFPAPKAPGEAESFTVSGPDVRDPGDPCRLVMATQESKQWWFGVRAVDELGNGSPFASGAVKSVAGLGLRYAQITTTGVGTADFGSYVFALGDINGDSMAELALGGDGAYPGFCILRGHTAVGSGLSLGATPANANVSCVKDSYASYQGYYLSPLGDVNGDGINDVGSLVYVLPSGDWSTNHRVYLGNAQGFVNTPAAVVLKFTGKDYWMATARSGGDFDGDGLGDIVVGVPEIDKAFIIPGSSQWSSAAPVTIDLLNVGDLATWRVVVIQAVGMAGWLFGHNAVAAGNVLPDAGEQQYGDLLLGASHSVGGVAYLLKGRPVLATTVLTLSSALGGSGSADLTAVRLKRDGVGGDYDFGFEIPGAVGIDGDSIPDPVIGHTAGHATADKSCFYIFYGAKLANALGQTVQVLGGADAGPKVYAGANGIRIQGAYSFITGLGNFDDAEAGGSLSVDLAHTDHQFGAVLGKVYFRLNQVGYSGQQGLLPFVDLTLSDPYTPGNGKFGRNGIQGAGDMNGDGLPDLYVPSKDSGYGVLVH